MGRMLAPAGRAAPQMSRYNDNRKKEGAVPGFSPLRRLSPWRRVAAALRDAWANDRRCPLRRTAPVVRIACSTGDVLIPDPTAKPGTASWRTRAAGRVRVRSPVWRPPALRAA
ncbi:hypothetical protein [Sphingomonas sp.]|uniref:hypothetical protein n=1 Tax=Sphingomonas sp. TaxID=28214 RepID=UPI003B3B656F